MTRELGEGLLVPSDDRSSLRAQIERELSQLSMDPSAGSMALEPLTALLLAVFHSNIAGARRAGGDAAWWAQELSRLAVPAGPVDFALVTAPRLMRIVLRWLNLWANSAVDLRQNVETKRHGSPNFLALQRSLDQLVDAPNPEIALQSFANGLLSAMLDLSSPSPQMAAAAADTWLTGLSNLRTPKARGVSADHPLREALLMLGFIQRLLRQQQARDWSDPVTLRDQLRADPSLGEALGMLIAGRELPPADPRLRALLARNLVARVGQGRGVQYLVTAAGEEQLTLAQGRQVSSEDGLAAGAASMPDVSARMAQPAPSEKGPTPQTPGKAGKKSADAGTSRRAYGLSWSSSSISPQVGP